MNVSDYTAAEEAHLLEIMRAIRAEQAEQRARLRASNLAWAARELRNQRNGCGHCDLGVEREVVGAGMCRARCRCGARWVEVEL